MVFDMSQLKYKSTSPLARLVLFMICLAIAGTLVAGIHYTFIDRPDQIAALQAPKNIGDHCSICREDYASCNNACLAPYNWFMKFIHMISCENACTPPAECQSCWQQGLN
jgi:hypothetical protein